MSCDGRNLAFVRRVRDVEALALKDLVPGTLRDIWFGLKYDLSITSAPISTSLTPESRLGRAIGAISNVIPLWYKLSHVIAHRKYDWLADLSQHFEVVIKKYRTVLSKQATTETSD